jgi:hypothetical protein
MDVDMRIGMKRDCVKFLMGWMGSGSSLVDLYKFCPSMEGRLQ